MEMGEISTFKTIDRLVGMTLDSLEKIEEDQSQMETARELLEAIRHTCAARIPADISIEAT